MVVLTSFSQPTDGIRHRQPNTTVFVNDDNLGKGTLYIAERLSWISDTGNGFALEYPHISLHAISRDLSAFPQECLFLMLDTALGDEENNEEENNEENGTDEPGSTEMRLIPDDRGMLDAMFHAMNACQALHPDPEDSFSDEDFYEDADDEIPMDETDIRMAGLRIENRDGRERIVGDWRPSILGREVDIGVEGIARDIEDNSIDIDERIGSRVGGTGGTVEDTGEPVEDTVEDTGENISFYRENGMAQGDRSFYGDSIRTSNTTARNLHLRETQESNFDDVEN